MSEEKTVIDPEELNLASGNKGYSFRIEPPKNAEELIELIGPFLEAFDLTFSLNEEKFEKFPKKFVKMDTVQEVENLF